MLLLQRETNPENPKKALQGKVRTNTELSLLMVNVPESNPDHISRRPALASLSHPCVIFAPAPYLRYPLVIFASTLLPTYLLPSGVEATGIVTIMTEKKINIQ